MNETQSPDGPTSAPAAKPFDEAAFDAAVSKPNGWSKIPDPVAEIRRMRDGDALPGNTPEPLAAIAHEIRTRAFQMFNEVSVIVKIDTLKEWADRIEAAAERERAEWRRQLRNEIQINDALATVRPQLHSVGDTFAEAAKERAHEIELAKLRATGAAAMRAALNSIADIAKDAFGGPEREREASQGRALSLIIDAARAALAAPARNCDVGTVDEQAERFKKFCFDHQAPWHGCTNCSELMSEKCAIAWSQKPFAPAEGGAE